MTTDGKQQEDIDLDLDPMEMAKTMAVAVSENKTLGAMAQAIDGYARLRIKAAFRTERAQSTMINIEVIVSGRELALTVPPKAKAATLVELALAGSGNEGQPPHRWELRTTDGVLIEPGVMLSDAGIASGMELYLSPRAGVGG